MGRSVLWDVLRVGRFKSWTFSDGTFLEWDVSRAGPFVCAPKIYLLLFRFFRPVKNMAKM